MTIRKIPAPATRPPTIDQFVVVSGKMNWKKNRTCQYYDKKNAAI